jgi:hypothetical protein
VKESVSFFRRTEKSRCVDVMNDDLPQCKFQ